MTNVHRNHPTDEALAAFLDGRSAPAERELVIAHAADCSRCAELMAEAARALEPESSRVLAFPSALRIPAWTWAAAAALIAAAGLGIAARYLAPGEPRSRALAAAFQDSRRVATLARSSPLAESGALAFDSSAHAAQAAAVRLGAASIDIEAALAAGDLPGAERAARRSPLVQRWLPAPNSTAAQLRRAVGAADRAIQAAGENARAAAAWGRWAESGRLAAAASDKEFLRSGVFRTARPATAPGGPAAGAEERALAAVDHGLAEVDSGGSLADLERAFERLLLVLG